MPVLSPADLAAQGIALVDCVVPDITGMPRGKRQPAAAFAQGAELRLAQAIPMQAVTGEYSYDPIFPDADPDVRLIPDLTTLRLAPWSPVGARRALALHDCLELDGTRCAFAPRQVLQSVLERYARRGLTPVVAPEIEFYLVAPNTDPTRPLQPPPLRHGRSEVGQSAFSLTSLDDLGPFWDAFQRALETLDVQADTWIHEVGRSQFEINLMHGPALAVADQAFLFKLAAKETALAHGMQAVFMAKPVAGEPGSSMHLHQSLVDSAGRNVFSDASGAATPLFAHFIGGLQRHLPDLMPVFAPFFNSFRRFVRNSQAPVNVHWGIDNRTAGLRVPLSAPQARRVENRLAGADANPYLAIAASLAAGLAGIEAGLQPGAPIEGNGYDASDDLPLDFVSALARMQATLNGTDEGAAGTAGPLLGERFTHAFCAVKALEHEHFMAEIGAWERRYLVEQA